MKVLIEISIVTVVIFVIHYLFPVIQICGDSMHPTYRDGEILVGTRLFRVSNLKKNDVIIYICPTDGRNVVKRIADITPQYNGEDLLFYCLGDNADHSYDSRAYGYISSKRIVCRLIKQRRNNRCM